jgi:tetratricopeptide (TPR) repeat protein
MLLATVLLSAALAPQAAQVPPSEATTPEPPAEASAKPAAPPATATSAAPYIDAGIAAFKKRHFAAAKSDFEKAEAADPQSAAAAFYLGYTYYKIGEPSKRMNANKEKAKELFARAFSLDPAFNPNWGRTK